MPKPISPKQLKKLTLNVKDKALKDRLSTLGSPYLDVLIREAGVTLEDRLRSASGLAEQKLEGVKLVDEALGPGKKLKFSDHEGEHVRDNLKQAHPARF